MSTTAPEGTTPAGQGQQTTDPTPPAATAAVPAAPSPVTGTGPWAADLAQAFEDEATRNLVDQFMRDKVQPHTTKLEQQIAEGKDAQALWKQFNDSPIDAYVAVTHELFGEAQAQQLLTALQQGQEQQQAQEQAQPGSTTPYDPTQDPRIAQMLQDYEDRQANSLYDEELAKISAAHPEIDTDMLHPFIAAAAGNFEEAVTMYAEWLSKLSPAEAAAVEEPPAPATLGSDTQTAQASATPTEPRQQSVHDAIDQWAAEQRANREAPPVIA